MTTETVNLVVLQVTLEQITAVAQGALIAAALAAMRFAQKRKKINPEKWNWYKFISTVLVGAVVGAGFILAGIPVNQQNVWAEVSSLGLAIIVVESIVKVVVRDLIQRGIIPRDLVPGGFETQYHN